jgi:Tn3 transposase DDE domain
VLGNHTPADNFILNWADLDLGSTLLGGAFWRKGQGVLQQVVEHGSVQWPGAVLVGIGQGGAFGRFAHAQMPQFPFAGGQTAGDFPQALRMPELAEQHGDQLGPTGEAAGMAFGFILPDLGLAREARDELQNLAENTAILDSWRKSPCRQKTVALQASKGRSGSIRQSSADPDSADQLGNHRTTVHEFIKFATALRLGTADAESILRRFTKNNVQHPTYKALCELGKALKTVFLCDYLRLKSLRREIHEGLQVIENWNSANTFILYGQGGEFVTNRLDDQEFLMLSLHLLQVSLVYVNTLMVQQVLAEPEWHDRLTPVDLRALSLLKWQHVNPYGTFTLNMQTRLALERGATLPKFRTSLG